EAVGGLERMWDYRQHLKDATHLHWLVQRAERLREDAMKARLEPRSQHECGFPVDGQEFIWGVEDAYSMYGWEKYVAEHPRPDGDFDTPEYEAWNATYLAWQRKNAPPFVF